LHCTGATGISNVRQRTKLVTGNTKFVTMRNQYLDTPQSPVYATRALRQPLEQAAAADGIIRHNLVR